MIEDDERDGLVRAIQEGLLRTRPRRARRPPNPRPVPARHRGSIGHRARVRRMLVRKIARCREGEGIFWRARLAALDEGHATYAVQRNDGSYTIGWVE